MEKWQFWTLVVLFMLHSHNQTRATNVLAERLHEIIRRLEQLHLDLRR